MQQYCSTTKLTFTVSLVVVVVVVVGSTFSHLTSMLGDITHVEGM